MIKDYLYLPDEVEGVGKVYPVSILEWEEFSLLAQRFLMYSYDMLKYRFKINDELDMLNFLFITIIQRESESERVAGILDLQRLLSIVLKKETKAYLVTSTGKWVVSVGDDEFTIDGETFDRLKPVIMRQNLIFEPLVAENEFGQQVIDDAIQRMSRQGDEVDLESMIAVVSVVKTISPSEFQNYSYYQLRADYEVSQRIENNRIVHLYRTQGGKGEPIGLTTPLSIHENPYGFDKLFAKVDSQKEEKLQKMLS